MPKMQDRQAKFKPVILMQDIDADYQVLDLGLMVILDKNIKKVGIWIPETPLGKKIVFSALMPTYRSKTVLDQSNFFKLVQVGLNRLVCIEFCFLSFLNETKIIWTDPNQFGIL